MNQAKLWKDISKSKKLKPNFINYYKNCVDWSLLLKSQDMEQNIINKHSDLILRKLRTNTDLFFYADLNNDQQNEIANCIKSVINTDYPDTFFDYLEQLITIENPLFKARHFILKEMLNTLKIRSYKKLQKIANGTYGYIYHINKTTALKIQNIEWKDYNENGLEEYIANIVLVCLFPYLSDQHCPFPEIKEICQIDFENTISIGCFMEKLEGNIIGYLYQHDFDFHLTIKIIIQICKVLLNLQNILGFIHRDFHTGNLMYKDAANGGIEIYIIDFATICATLNSVDSFGLETRIGCTNRSLDMQILLSSMCQILPDDVRKIITPLFVSNKQYKKVAEKERLSVDEYLKLSSSHYPFYGSLKDNDLQQFYPENLIVYFSQKKFKLA